MSGMNPVVTWVLREIRSTSGRRRPAGGRARATAGRGARANPWPRCPTCRHRTEPPLCPGCGRCPGCVDRCERCGRCTQLCRGHRDEQQR